jgi:hypothetical protein
MARSSAARPTKSLPVRFFAVTGYRSAILRQELSLHRLHRLKVSSVMPGRRQCA